MAVGVFILAVLMNRVLMIVVSMLALMRMTLLSVSYHACGREHVRVHAGVRERVWHCHASVRESERGHAHVHAREYARVFLPCEYLPNKMFQFKLRPYFIVFR